jgi:hypothetical protein
MYLLCTSILLFVFTFLFLLSKMEGRSWMYDDMGGGPSFYFKKITLAKMHTLRLNKKEICCPCGARSM